MHAPPKELTDRLVKLYQRGQISDVVEEAQFLTERFPEDFVVWNILGAACRSLGRNSEAATAFEKVTELKPNYAVGFNNFGVVLHDQGKLDEAISSFKRAVLLDSRYAEAWFNMGNAFNDHGKLENSVDSFNRAVLLKPDYADAYNNLGNVLRDQGKLDDAISAYQKALSNKPDSAQASCNIANMLQGSGKLNEALEYYRKALSLKPDYTEAYVNMGSCYKALGEPDEAINSYKKALQLRPDYEKAYELMGNALRAQGKLDEAITSYRRAISLGQNCSSAFNNMGNALQDQGKVNEAMRAYKKALSGRSNYADPYFNIGNVLRVQGKLNEALKAYNKGLLLEPDNAAARAQKLYVLAQVCDWEAIERDRLFLPDLGVTGKSIPPLSVLSLEDSPDRHLIRSQNYVSKSFPSKALAFSKKSRRNLERLRIGYFSSDFNQHPVSYLIAGVIESHDRGKFEIFGYSLGFPVMDSMRERLSNSFCKFRDVHSFTDLEIVKKARDDEIDIAIDLTGHTQNSRSRIFSYGLAPIQMNYLGYPGSLGNNSIDYIIADRNLIPEDSQKYYSEKLLYLPYHYQAQDDKLEIDVKIPTRSSLSLPEEGFVFCAINNTYKITSREFDIWARLLKRVRGSILWLQHSNCWAKNNLLKEASLRGLDPQAIVFAKKVAHEKYLAQFCQADLYLDTFNYNAGATASNALWAGLPLITKQGKSYTARMASSLLKSIGLEELITTSELEYESLAVKLAENPEQLLSIKRRLANNRKTMPLFNTKVFTRHLEDGFLQAYRRYVDGKKPDTISVDG